MLDLYRREIPERAENGRYLSNSGGPRSEALGQARLFNEVEVAALATPETPAAGEPSDQAGFAPAATTDDTAADPGKKKPAAKARGKRAALAIDLPRVDVIHELSEAERTAPDGTLMVVIGQEVSEQLDIGPAEHLVQENDSLLLLLLENSSVCICFKWIHQTQYSLDFIQSKEEPHKERRCGGSKIYKWLLSSLHFDQFKFWQPSPHWASRSCPITE